MAVMMQLTVASHTRFIKQLYSLLDWLGYLNVH
jgi:hypothetical protein